VEAVAGAVAAADVAVVAVSEEAPAVAWAEVGCAAVAPCAVAVETLEEAAAVAAGECPKVAAWHAPEPDQTWATGPRSETQAALGQTFLEPIQTLPAGHRWAAWVLVQVGQAVVLIDPEVVSPIVQQVEFRLALGT
jgi:hypothetical protein